MEDASKENPALNATEAGGLEVPVMSLHDSAQDLLDTYMAAATSLATLILRIDRLQTMGSVMKRIVEEM